MAVLDRYLGELEGLYARTAAESLTNISDSEKNSFGFGKAVGRLEGIKLAQSVLNRLLNEPEVDERGSGRNRNKA